MAEAGAVPAHEVTEADWGRLRAAAADALELAYAPYSGYRVGAAALTEDGRTESTVENRKLVSPATSTLRTTPTITWLTR